MSRIEEKLEHFANDVMADVGEERLELVEEVDRQLRKENEEKEKELLSEAYEIIQNAMIEIDQEKNEKLSKVIMGNRMKLLAKRNELLARMYDKVLERLIEFKGTDAYIEHLLALIEDAVAQVGEGNISVTLDYSDRQLMKVIEEKTGYKVVCESKKVNLVGGCKVCNIENQVIVDSSFARKLEDSRDDFVHKCKLEIE